MINVCFVVRVTISMFPHEDAKRIINISLPGRPVRDSWLWLPSTNGEFAIKSAYRLLKNGNHSNEGDGKWKSIWGAKIHNRLKMFWWRLLANCIPTKERLIAALKTKSQDIHNLQFNIQDYVHKFLSFAGKLNLWEIVWAPRACNGVAHSVAQWANRINKFGFIDLANFGDSLQLFNADGHGSV
uniref:Reverse transcriptase zinc-binding domain-containing protein n=1 Tax=Cannabis sativa TaxID=3483 RepID=A0A803PX00_CANSA